MKFITKSEKETKELAKKIAKDLKIGDILLLEGELGVRKNKIYRRNIRAL